jgi:hypothetical protein
MDNEAEKALKARVQRDYRGINFPKKTQTITLAGIAAGVLITLALLSQGESNNIKNNNNSTIISNSTVETFLYENRPNLRQWHELSKQEKTAFKEEAIRKFPEIKRIGQGVSWKPIAEWMAEEKGIIHSNPRDLFR